MKLGSTQDEDFDDFYQISLKISGVQFSLWRVTQSPNVAWCGVAPESGNKDDTTDLDYHIKTQKPDIQSEEVTVLTMGKVQLGLDKMFS